MRSTEALRPVYLEGRTATLAGFLHEAPAGAVGTAVLLSPPFGWDDMCSYRIRRAWAERLAGAGHPTLRFDLPGTGDSTGGPEDPGLLEAWTESLEEAARWLNVESGAPRLAVVGIGLGGLLALRAALAGAPITDLVLWSVPTRGRTLVRELRSFSAFELANRPSDGSSAEPPGAPQDGSLTANGYLISAETVAALEDLDFRDTDPGSWAVRRALVLGRDGIKPDAALPGLLERGGARVTVADGPGYGTMMTEPQDAQPPVEVFECVEEWLSEGARAGADSEPAGLESRGTARVPAVERRELILRSSARELVERPLLFEGPTGRLFGVITEPVDAPQGLTAVLLNAGPQRRTGPSRMWVEIARRWAAMGVTTLRLDAEGIGDSDGDAAALGRVTAFYRPVYVEQARAALGALSEQGLPQRFLMLGLCSGAYWSAQTALADERVSSVVMLNPRTLVFDEWRHTVRRTRHLRQRAMMPSTWGRVLRGDIKLSKHLETGRTVLGQLAGAPRRAGQRVVTPRAVARDSQPPLLTRIEGLFDQLRDRDQRATLLFTGAEVLRREMTEQGMLDRLERWPNLELALMGTDADTHTLTPPWLQQQVHELLDRVLIEELGRVTGS